MKIPITPIKSPQFTSPLVIPTPSGSDFGRDPAPLLSAHWGHIGLFPGRKVTQPPANDPSGILFGMSRPVCKFVGICVFWFLGS